MSYSRLHWGIHSLTLPFYSAFSCSVTGLCCCCWKCSWAPFLLIHLLCFLSSLVSSASAALISPASYCILCPYYEKVKTEKIVVTTQEVESGHLSSDSHMLLTSRTAPASYWTALSLSFPIRQGRLPWGGGINLKPEWDVWEECPTPSISECKSPEVETRLTNMEIK